LNAKCGQEKKTISEQSGLRREWYRNVHR